jgi:hypothetical protein
MHKLLLSVAALIAALTVAWTAFHGVEIRLKLDTDHMYVDLDHDGDVALSHGGSIMQMHSGHIDHSGNIGRY